MRLLLALAAGMTACGGPPPHVQQPTGEAEEVPELLSKKPQTDGTLAEEQECTEGSTGTLEVNTVPPMSVSVDGVKVEDTPLIDHELSQGEHEVVLSSDLYGIKKVLNIKIKPCHRVVILKNYEKEIWGCVESPPEADEAWTKKLDDPNAMFPPEGLPRPLLQEDIACTMDMLYPKIARCEGIQWGSLTLSVVVNEDGTVKAAKVHGKQADTKVGECITDILHKAVFPPFERGPTRDFTWPLAFPVEEEGPESEAGGSVL